jgi:dTDP-glucose 4,6-dehydratase
MLNSYQRPGQVQRHISSTAKASALLGWRARTPFPTALEQTIQWYTDNAWWWRKLAYPAGAAPAVAHS